MINPHSSPSKENERRSAAIRMAVHRCEIQ